MSASRLPRIPNRQIRRALLSLNGLAPPFAGDGLHDPAGTSGEGWVHGMTRRLGFVQVDAVSAVERCQHHILFARNPRYKQAHLVRLIERERRLFENWTHDAAILPVELYPYWRHYFERVKRFEPHPGYARYFAAAKPADVSRALRRIRKEGPLRPRDVDNTKVSWNNDRYSVPTVAKVAMELLWRTGKLAVSRRDGREKVYDLAERVVPPAHFKKRVSRSTYVDWACREALKRLGTGTPSQIVHFFDALSRQDVEAWCRRRLGQDVIQVRPVHADGSTGGAAFALTSFVEAISNAPAAPRGLRLLNPFDPLIHDRQRTRRLFGFDYAIEIWVPARKRKYGYYVLPILEGQRFTGRIDCKVDRKRDELVVLGLWWEAGVKATKARMGQLDKELRKLAGFTGVADVAGSHG